MSTPKISLRTLTSNPHASIIEEAFYKIVAGIINCARNGENTETTLIGTYLFDWQSAHLLQNVEEISNRVNELFVDVHVRISAEDVSGCVKFKMVW